MKYYVFDNGNRKELTLEQFEEQKAINDKIIKGGLFEELWNIKFIFMVEEEENE